ncbi:VirK/YbjX family protein [Paucibacter sp. B2R-40]|uniref:VirK/YbjX family protein n=1 Tax=Paucibacter sp. B2R-40 TaxID=2893554 RepID=UPI0021E3E9EF|nr:VirK/YbjX family protein [Paucibacter sp. B2R-40]MCV2356077.1 VirK/YbjX family protein [Paucibacter sp. B2R-40]
MSQTITLNSGLSGRQGLPRLRESIKIGWRAFANRPATSAWLQLLNAHSPFSELVKHKPSLVLKIYRPYLSNTLNCSQRLALLQAHYHFIFSQGLAPLVVRAAQQAVLLAQVEGKSGASYGIELSAIAPLEREGELVLRLVQGETLIYSAAFSFFRESTQLALGIGCMQGPQGEDGLQHIRQATQDFHGLRPKCLMLRLLAHLGHGYGCRQLLLVGNANLAHRSAARKGKIFADYNSLWEEMGARQRTDGDYQLSCEPLSPPDLTAIASKKRSEARKRFDTLLALAHALSSGLQAQTVHTHTHEHAN